MAASLLSLAWSPVPPTAARVRAAAPWVGVGLAATELAFTGGLAAMALAAGRRLGPKPWRWRAGLPQLLASSVGRRWFRVGLAVNTAGAVGTALVLAAGIVVGLPPRAWGLLIVPVGDLALTVALRAAVLASATRARATPPPPRGVPGPGAGAGR